MMPRRTYCVVFFTLCGSLAWGAVSKASPPKRGPEPPPPATVLPSAPAVTESPGGAKIVQYTERDVIPVKAKLRYTTLIVLPKTEQILDFTCGDKDFWIVNGNQNLAYIKPAKGGAQSNLNLVTASGNIYSFILKEVSELSGAEPDLKLFVELNDGGMSAAAANSPRFVPARELEDSRRQLEAAQEEVRRAKDATQTAIENGMNRFVTNVRFDYRFEAGKKPFGIRAMYHDEKFTYIQARPEEPPTLYEIKDGKPNLVNFEYRNGVYIVSKLIDRGYLAIGKQKLAFRRED